MTSETWSGTLLIPELSSRFFSALAFIPVLPKAVKTGHGKVILAI